MSKKNESWNLKVNDKQKKTIANTSGGGGNKWLAFKLLMSLDDKTRINGLTAKQIANGVNEQFEIAVADSLMRDFFRDEFNVGRVKGDDSKYDMYNQKTINGTTYVAIAHQTTPMRYSLCTTQDEFNILFPTK